MKVRERLTKKAVLTEIQRIRSRINEAMEMTDGEIRRHYLRTHPNEKRDLSANELRRHYMMSATFYATNVLNVE